MSTQYSVNINNYDITFRQELISLIQIHNISHNFINYNVNIYIYI